MQAKSAKDVQRSNRAFLGKVFNDIIMMWKEEEVGLAHTHTPPPNGSIHREPVTTKGVCMYKWCWCTEYHWKNCTQERGPLGPMPLTCTEFDRSAKVVKSWDQPTMAHTSPVAQPEEQEGEHAVNP